MPSISVKARSRASFIKATATELFVDADIIKRDIGQLLLKLETLQATADRRRQSTETEDVSS